MNRAQAKDGKKAEKETGFTAQLQATLNVIPAYTWYAAPSGGLTFVNKRTADYLGLPKDHPLRFGVDIGARWDAHIPLLHPDDQEESRKAWSTCLRTGEAAEFSQRLRNAQGEYRWFLSRAEPLRADDGALLHWVGVNLDIEYRTRALAQLEQTQADFARMNRVSMMGELAASLSHEITQPIGSARNNARAAENFLDMQPPHLGEARDAVRCILDDTDRAGAILDRIRGHIRKAPSRKGQFDLNEAISEIVVLGRSAIIKNGVSVQTRFSEELFPVYGDRVQLQQVVLNLLLNAVEAMSSVDGQRDLLISTEQDHTGVLVAVRDSGPGIDPAHLEHIFESFYTTKPNGTGMGLSICRSIISCHGGRLWAEPNDTRGAIFQFTLPAVQMGS